MHALLDQTFPAAVMNIAADEALLDWCEASGRKTAVVRIWEPARPLVVLGRASQAAQEVNLAACGARGVPILRRSSGGATIVAGPGCLMYAIVLSLETNPELRLVDQAHAWVLSRLVTALSHHLPTIARSGTSDLSFLVSPGSEPGLDPRLTRRRKFSGNSLRLKRTHLLYHGTLLYRYDLDLMTQLLRHPPREPDYRQGREHTHFVANLPLRRQPLRDAVENAFAVTERLATWPETSRIDALVAERYADDAWTYCR